MTSPCSPDPATYYEPPASAPKKGWSTLAKVGAGIGGLFALLVSCGVGAGVGGGDPTARPAATVTVTGTTTLTVTKSASAATVTSTVTSSTEDDDEDDRATSPVPAWTIPPLPTRDAEDEQSSSNDGSAYYPNCSAVRSAGKAPIRRDDPGYGSHLDRDGDGIACET